MKRAERLKEMRSMRFEELYVGWHGERIDGKKVTRRLADARFSSRKWRI